MRLVFIELRQGREVSEVRLEGGELVGPRPMVEWVENTMVRWGLDVEGALRRLDGWTNGYAALRLHSD